MGKYDTFRQRFFALFIDGLLLNAIIFILQLIPDAPNTLSYLIITVISVNLPYIYSVITLGKIGQTIGKIVTKVKVVDNTTEGSIGYYQAFLRDVIPIVLVNLFIVLSLILYSDVDPKNYQLTPLGNFLIKAPNYMLIIWSITEIVTMMLNSKNRALHDYVAETVVIRIDKKYF